MINLQRAVWTVINKRAMGHFDIIAVVIPIWLKPHISQ